MAFGLVLGIAGLAAPGCGDSKDNPDGSDVADGGNGMDGPPPTPSPFGLDTRPANTTCVAPQRPPSAAPVRFERQFPNLSLTVPMAANQIPGDGSRWFVALRAGTLVSFPVANPTTMNRTTVLTIPVPVQTAGEGGFLGFAFHPKFLQNGHVYLSFTTTSSTSPANMKSVVARMTSMDGGKTFGAYTEILSFDQPYSNHDGGDIEFGKDGFLYIAFGDGGSGGDPLNYGQNKNTFFSKILRVDVDNPQGGKPYGIPAGNPFAMGGGEPATFTYGLRNPFRMSLDRDTGELWIGDVGQNAWEEIHEKVKPGANLGWRFREGKHCYNPMNNCPTAGLTDPIWEYNHSQGTAVIGGNVYRGKAMPAFNGTYLFADNGSGRVWSLVIGADNKPTVADVMAAGGGWVDFTEDNDGEIYLVSLGGSMHKLVPAGMQMPSMFPDKLSKTGCVDPMNPKTPSSGLIPFAPHAQLWSDGAEKHRWMALPDGKTITVNADGDFDFPNGSVMVKEFRVGGKRVETRLLVRHDDGGWAGYTYEWDDAETDATLLQGAKTRVIGNQTWYYPSRSECNRCHTTAAGNTLGPEIGQLNWEYVYAQTNRLSNQLRTLEHIGLFSKPLGAPPEQLVSFPDPVGNGLLDARARAYLHANCASCHRPQGGGGGNQDFRFSTPLGNAAACDTNPNAGDLGIMGAKILAPGDPDKSLIVARAARTGADRMPPLASSVVDTAGTNLLRDWVKSISSCPGPVDAGTD